MPGRHLWSLRWSFLLLTWLSFTQVTCAACVFPNHHRSIRICYRISCILHTLKLEVSLWLGSDISFAVSSPEISNNCELWKLYSKCLSWSLGSCWNEFKLLTERSSCKAQTTFLFAIIFYASSIFRFHLKWNNLCPFSTAAFGTRQSQEMQRQVKLKWNPQYHCY